MGRFYKYLPNVIQYNKELDIYSFIKSLSNDKKTFSNKQINKLTKLLQLNSYKYYENIEQADRNSIIDIYMKMYSQK